MADTKGHKAKRETRCFEHNGYHVQQSGYNNHIMIVKDDRMVFHAQCRVPYSEKQLRQVVDGYIKYCESHDAIDIWWCLEEDDE